MWAVSTDISPTRTSVVFGPDLVVLMIARCISVTNTKGLSKNKIYYSQILEGMGGRRKKERDRECVRICVFTLEG